MQDDRVQLVSPFATRQVYDLRQIAKQWQILPNMDPILRAHGNDVEIYEDIKNEPHVSATVQSRVSSVLQREWDIDLGKQKSREARLVKSVFDDLDIEHIITEIIDATHFGRQFMEIYWRPGHRFMVPRDILAKPLEWFYFDTTANARMNTRSHSKEGKLLPPKKFLLPRHQWSYKNPYGVPLLGKCFWPVTFKKGSNNFWFQFLERYSIPLMIEKYDDSLARHDVQWVRDELERLEGLGQSSRAVIPKSSELELLEASGGQSAVFEGAGTFWNAEISKVMVSQTLTTEIGAVGSYAASQTHLDVHRTVTDSLIRLAGHWMNILSRYIVEENFAFPQSYPLFRMFEQDDVDMNLAQRDSALIGTGQFSFRKAYYSKMYGFEESEFILTGPGADADTAEEQAKEEAKKPKPFVPLPASVEDPTATATDPQQVPDAEAKPAELSLPPVGGFLHALNHAAAEEFQQARAFARADQILEQLEDAIAPETMVDVMNPVMAPILKMIRSADNLTDIRSNLATLYGDMDDTEFEELLGRVLVVSDALGQHSEAVA